MDNINKNPLVPLNNKRLEYLLELYGLSNQQFLKLININQNNLPRKRPLFTEETLNIALKETMKIPLYTVKAIDKVFNKGLLWYITARPLSKSESSSIFFRKNKFNSELNLQSKKVTNNFEKKKFEIQNLCASIDFDPKRNLKTHILSENPRQIANEFRKEFKIIETRLIKNKRLKKPTKEREYLRNLMTVIEDYNIFVFEFIENHNQKEVVNFDGFFMSPNVIVVKKQYYPKREIFTLLHEFAHYLLNIEEIDEINEKTNLTSNLHERWCNDFVYYFLIEEQDEFINKLELATPKNNYYKYELTELAKSSLISVSSLYTRLKILNKIDGQTYYKIMLDITEMANKKRIEEKARNKEEREKQKALGNLGGFAIKPIQSNLFKEVVKFNYFQGNISENTLCKYLRIRPESIQKEIY